MTGSAQQPDLHDARGFFEGRGTHLLPLQSRVNDLLQSVSLVTMPNLHQLIHKSSSIVVSELLIQN
jgi:hypothetical protein